MHPFLRKLGETAVAGIRTTAEQYAVSSRRADPRNAVFNMTSTCGGEPVYYNALALPYPLTTQGPFVLSSTVNHTTPFGQCLSDALGSFAASLPKDEPGAWKPVLIFIVVFASVGICLMYCGSRRRNPDHYSPETPEPPPAAPPTPVLEDSSVSASSTPRSG